MEMELLRETKNVWGQKMLVGVSWDLLWIPVAAALAFLVLHFLNRLRRRRSKHAAHKNHQANSVMDAASHEGLRHKLLDRLFHWGMAITMFVLLFSAFLPIVGIEFDWIPWHWIAGVLLTLLVIFHIVRALFIQGLSTMLPRGHDFKRGGYAASDAKYDILQKSYHWGVAATTLGVIASGIPMLIKLDTFLWDRNPGLLTDLSWGYVYVVHGITALLLIFLVILHVYFSFLPEHKALLKSMVFGKGPLHPLHDDHPGENK